MEKPGKTIRINFDVTAMATLLLNIFCFAFRRLPSFDILSFDAKK